MQCRIVDFSKRWPVLEETTGQTSGAPESEQTKADITLSIINLDDLYIMPKPKPESQPEGASLDGLENDTRRKVLQLINREEQELKGPVLREEHRYRVFIDPTSRKAFLWNLGYIALFYLMELQISLSLGFGPHFFEDQLGLTSFYRPIYIVFLVLLILDSFFSFCKGYYVFGRGKIVDDGRQVALHYLSGQFIFDLVVISLYVVPLVRQSIGLNFLQLVPASLIWVKKFDCQRQAQMFLQYRPFLRAGFTITILVIDVLMIGNYGACIFVGLDLFLYNESVFGQGDSSPWYWLTSNTAYPISLLNGPWYYQYIYGQQFSTGTLSTLAPGPFAKNPYEILYSILVMIFFVVLASYVTEVLIEIMYTYRQRRIFHEDNIITFDRFLHLKEVARSIRRRVYNFFQLVWEVELKMENKEQQEMIDKLPLYLKQELLQEIGFTNRLAFLLHLPLQKSLARLLSLHIQPQTLDAATAIFQPEEFSKERSLFFIREGLGKISLLLERHEGRNRQIILGLSSNQKVLGVYQFITGQDYCVSCTTVDLCMLQTLSWTDFCEVMAQLNIEEKFKQLQHRVLFEKDLTLIDQVCTVCLGCHLENHCPEIFPRAKFVYGLISEQRIRENRRISRQRKNIRAKKVISRERKNDAEGLFEMLPGINLGKLLVDLHRWEFRASLETEEVAFFEHYFCDHNLPLCP